MLLSRASRRILLLSQRCPRVARTFASLPKGLEPLAMPALSPTMDSGTISQWLKKEGEEANAGDVLCQVETDKAVVDYEVQDDIVLAKILKPDGTSDIPVGETLAYTVADLDTFKQLEESGALANLTGESSASSDSESTTSASESDDSSQSTASTASKENRKPLIHFLGKRSLLPKENLDHTPANGFFSAIYGSNKSEAEAGSTPKSAPSTESKSSSPEMSSTEEYEDIKLSNMRKTIAKRLTASKTDVPHHYFNVECEIDNIMSFRKQLKEKHGIKVSLNDFILKAVALALRDVPEAHAHFDLKEQVIKSNESTDIAVAVATDNGLITPIVPGVDVLGLSGINSKFRELVKKARSNKLKPEEYQGGVFAISNLGGMGIDEFTAVVNPPHSCILAVGSGRKELVAPDDYEIVMNGDVEEIVGEPKVVTMMSSTLSCDRRVLDDVVAGQFLQTFKTYMESPELLTL